MIYLMSHAAPSAPELRGLFYHTDGLVIMDVDVQRQSLLTFVKFEPGCLRTNVVIFQMPTLLLFSYSLFIYPFVGMDC